MIIEILNEQGEVLNHIIADENFAEAVYPGMWRVHVPKEPEESFPEVEDLISQIKIKTFSAIKETDWRVERAKERSALGLPLTETLEEIYAYREELRQKSNDMEAHVYNSPLKDLKNFEVVF